MHHGKNDKRRATKLDRQLRRVCLHACKRGRDLAHELIEAITRLIGEQYPHHSARPRVVRSQGRWRNTKGRAATPAAVRPSLTALSAADTNAEKLIKKNSFQRNVRRVL
jgi:hypothetical protein